MAPQKSSPRRGLQVLAFTGSIMFALGTSAPLMGQAVDVFRSPWEPHVDTSIGSILNAPNPNSRPSTDQTRWYVNSHPDLQTLNSGMKEVIIYAGPSSGLLNGTYLPNGRPNPFISQSNPSVIQPNWYVPATWSSPVMNWQGVQPNGFQSSTFTTTYNPNTFTTTYHPSVGLSASTPSTYLPTYRPQPAPSFTPQPNTNQALVSAHSFDMHRVILSNSIDLQTTVTNQERTWSLHEAAADKIAQVVDNAQLARLLIREGKPEEALKILAISRTVSLLTDDPKRQLGRFQLEAVAHLSLGEFEQSILSYRQAMQIQRSLHDEAGQGQSFVSVGWIFQSLGNTPDALASYQSALNLFQKLKSIDGEVTARLAIASLYQSMGEFDKALDQYGKALPKSSNDQYARILVSVSEILQSRDQPATALKAYNEALLFHSPGDATMEATILTGIGRCQMTLGAYKEARKYLERARSIMVSAGNRAGEAGVVASIAELDYSKAIASPGADPTDRFMNALKGFDEALVLMRSVGDRTGEIGALTDKGLVYDAWGKRREAVSYYRQALQKMDELQNSARLEEFRIDLADQAARVYGRAIELEISMHQKEEAFDLSERARARTFLDQIGNKRIRLASNFSPEFTELEENLRKQNILLQRQLGQELARPGPDLNQDRIRSLQSQVSAIRKEHEDSLAEVKVSNPDYASFLSISPLTLQQAQREIRPDLTVVSYYTTPGMTFAFVLTRDSFYVATINVAETQLSGVVASFLDFAGPGEAAASLKLLYKWLIVPLKSHLRTSTLAVVPYGVLHDLPFAALTADGRRFLGDEYAVFSLPSVSVLTYIHMGTKHQLTQALVMANDEAEGVPHLNYAYDEAHSVASIFGTQPLLGKAATTAILRAKAGDYDVLHVVAHIEHDSRHPQSSRVILGEGGDTDGPLDLDEILDLDLRRTSLVVLSGCQSQRGKRSRGDDIVGLTRAFIYAGSASVIASLWDVDDDATKQLMIAFYKHLRDGRSKVEALRMAQLDVRQKYPHPYYWAAFVLTGDPGASGASAGLLANSSN